MGAHVAPTAYERFDELLAAGLSLTAAAKQAGVSRRGATYRWKRIGGMPLQKGRRGGLPRPPEPEPVPAPAGPFEKIEGQLRYFERCVIQVRLREGRLQTQIAAELAVICREVKRNKREDGVYDARHADAEAARRRRRPKACKLARNPELAAVVEDRLGDGWSPDLISQVLKQDHPDDRSMQVSHETVYQALYVQPRGVLRQDLYRCLSPKHAKRAPQGRAARNHSPYAGALKISQRPPAAEDRAVPGHWEGDSSSAATAAPRSGPWSSGPPGS